MRLALVALWLAATPAMADGAKALDSVILPGIAAFARAAQGLDAAARADCTRAAVLPAYHAARDAWGAIGDMRLGPGEQAALTIAFWPDDRASGARALKAGADPLPASARGFSGLDLMLGDPGLDYGPTDPGCALVRRLTADLSAQAAALERDWAAFAPMLRSPGTAGNLTWLDDAEVRRALFTQALAGLELTLAQRIGRPLGEVGRPRPARAEHWRTRRPLPNVLAAARAAHRLGAALAPGPVPAMDAALRTVEAAATEVADPGFQDIADSPGARLRLEILGQRIADLRKAIEAEVGAPLGIRPGFNALDGD